MTATQLRHHFVSVQPSQNVWTVSGTHAASVPGQDMTLKKPEEVTELKQDGGLKPC